MSIGDILVLCLIGLALFFAVRSRVLSRKNGYGCCGTSCAGCRKCGDSPDRYEKRT